MQYNLIIITTTTYCGNVKEEITTEIYKYLIFSQEKIISIFVTIESQTNLSLVNINILAYPIIR